MVGGFTGMNRKVGCRAGQVSGWTVHEPVSRPVVRRYVRRTHVLFNPPSHLPQQNVEGWLHGSAYTGSSTRFPEIQVQTCFFLASMLRDVMQAASSKQQATIRRQQVASSKQQLRPRRQQEAHVY